MPEGRICSEPRCTTIIPLTAHFCSVHNAPDRPVFSYPPDRSDYPWRIFYELPEWKACRSSVLARDRYCCVKCGERRGVSVHHRVLVRTLWERSGGDWDAFIAAASDPDGCEALCGRHHKQADDRLRREERVRFTAPQKRRGRKSR